MKRVFFILSVLLSVLVSEAQQAGRVRVLFKGFKCIQETADDILQGDGKGNEVFFQFYFSLADRNGVQKLKYAFRSDVYGDNTAPTYRNRIAAGSAVDLLGNLPGGIKSNDNFETTKVIGEYDLGAGDVLTLIPTIWEWNTGIGNEGLFDATIENSGGIINSNAASLSSQRFGKPAAAGSISTAELTRFIYLDPLSALGVNTILKVIGQIPAKSRPVGISKDGSFSPKALLFTGNAMQEIARMNFGYGMGIVPVQYNDLALNNDRDHGNYIILLKVEFYPSNTPATNTPANTPASTSNNPPPPKDLFTGNKSNPLAVPGTSNTGYVPPLKKTIAASSPTFLSGTWSGTTGNGDLMGPYFFSMIFNADGTMQLPDQNGILAAKGSYKIVNYVITGTYTYLRGEQYGFTGTLNGNTMTGTWGKGANTSGFGKWTMSKK